MKKGWSGFLCLVKRELISYKQSLFEIGCEKNGDKFQKEE